MLSKTCHCSVLEGTLQAKRRRGRRVTNTIPQSADSSSSNNTLKTKQKKNKSKGNNSDNSVSIKVVQVSKLEEGDVWPPASMYCPKIYFHIQTGESNYFHCVWVWFSHALLANLKSHFCQDFVCKQRSWTTVILLGGVQVSSYRFDFCFYCEDRQMWGWTDTKLENICMSDEQPFSYLPTGFWYTNIF